MARTKRKTNPAIPAAEVPAQAQKQYRAAAYGGAHPQGEQLPKIQNADCDAARQAGCGKKGTYALQRPVRQLVSELCG